MKKKKGIEVEIGRTGERAGLKAGFGQVARLPYRSSLR